MDISRVGKVLSQALDYEIQAYPGAFTQWNCINVLAAAIAGARDAMRRKTTFFLINEGRADE